LGWEGGKGKEWERIEEGKDMKGRGRNVAFHHLVLSNLTTAFALTLKFTVPQRTVQNCYTLTFDCAQGTGPAYLSNIVWSAQSLSHPTNIQTA